MSRKAIKFDDGQLAVVYLSTDIRAKLTDKQALDFGFAKKVIPVKKDGRKEILIIGGYHA